MVLYYPQQNEDFDLTIPLDKSSANQGVEELVVSFRYIDSQWYLSLWYDGKFLVQNQTAQSGIDLFSKFSAYKLGKFIIQGDTTSQDCFLNWPVEIGYDA